MFVAKWKNRSATPTYYAWKGMRARCFDERHKAWHRYGGRGITVCDRWKDDYDAFVEDMGLVPKGLTLERIDNEGNYEPGNCRWATRAEQSRNRSGNRFLTFRGETKVITDWAAEIGLSLSGIQHRINQGLSVEEALDPEWRREAEAPHGTVSRYTNRKCRCDPCKAAMLAYNRKWRYDHGQRPIPLAPHGTTARYAKKCRCDECRKARSLYVKSRANK